VLTVDIPPGPYEVSARAIADQSQQAVASVRLHLATPDGETYQFDGRTIVPATEIVARGGDPRWMAGLAVMAGLSLPRFLQGYGLPGDSSRVGYLDIPYRVIKPAPWRLVPGDDDTVVHVFEVPYTTNVGVSTSHR
jgi:hypothetical protein